jgi:DNA-binding transcriptional MocR family regulator
VALAGVIRGSQLARLLGAWPSTRGPRGSRLPEYAALAAAVRALLHDGRLGLGVRVPAERELATSLAVSRTTVTAAYRELRDSGHLTSRRGAGSWTALPEGQRIATSGLWGPIDEADVLDLATAALGAPDELALAARAALDDLPPYTRRAGYAPAGLAPLRDAVAQAFTRRGLPTRVEQILITNGVQHAVDLLLRLTVAPGQSALVEQPTYPNMLSALRSHRSRVVASTVDREEGWDGDALISTVRTMRPAVAYVIPEFQNPTGHLMPAGLRERLTHAVHAAGTDLIVDESFVELALEPGLELPAPVASFDRHARVLTVGGVTKPYWGGLRVGWIRAAAPVIARLSALRVTVDMSGPVLDQLIALRLLEQADDVLATRRRQLRARRDALVGALQHHCPEWTFTVPAGGTCLWVELDGPVSTALAHAGLEHGVRLAPGPHFAADAVLERFLRLPFTLPESDLIEAMARIAKARGDLDRARPADWSDPSLVA